MRSKLPAAAAHLFTGVKLADAVSLVQPEEMITVALVLFVCAALANALMLWSEHRLHGRV